MLYMSLLAQYLAEVDRQATVPGTDIVEHETAALLASEGGLPGVEVRLWNAVPTPRADVSIGQILDFKRTRASELLAYRAHVDTLFADLATIDSRSAVRDALVRFDEAQRRDLTNLGAALDDARLATVWGTAKAIVKANTPAFWGGAAVAAGFAATAAALPLSITLAGMAVVGAIEVKAYQVDKRNERRAALRNSPLAYLYHAREERILDAR